MSDSAKKLWGGRFDSPPAHIMEEIGESISFDYKLYKFDIQGSIAHSRMLNKIGILSNEEQASIENGLNQILNEIQTGTFVFQKELEDIHMNIESALTEKIGEAGKKLHTARSRNDQVSQDVRLYTKSACDEIIKEGVDLLKVLLSKAEESVDVFFPGYTHLQIAQPIRASHYFLSHFWAIERDLALFSIARDLNDTLVLGSGALAGLNYPSDREFLAKELNLSYISPNSMDAVSQRDHILSFLFASTQTMVHLSRICEDIILYSSTEFGYIQLPDHLTTGSSIMPQKKNPDIAELIRGKSAKAISNLNHVLIMMKGTPMTYNRDFQEDKIALFDSNEQTHLSLRGVKAMIQGMKLNSTKIQASLEKGFATATDLADFLVTEKKIPFREAHEIVGKLVSECQKRDCTLQNAPPEIRNQIHPSLMDEKFLSAIALETSCDKKNTFGGTSKKRQEEQILIAKTKLNSISSKVS
jgi:argininosuccinate lyase